MALQGTLDTFALPDVLRLLASTKKTGRLRVSGNRGTGSVWVDAGKVVASEATGLPDSPQSVDVLFELLRYGDGSFTFEAGTTAANPAMPTDVEPLLIEAEHQLIEWREIEAVVPSMEAWVTLVPELPRPDVVIDGDRWRTIVTVGSGSSVASIGRALDLGEVAVCRIVKDLVELGLGSVATSPGISFEAAPAVVEALTPSLTVAEPAIVLDDAAASAPAPEKATSAIEASDDEYDAPVSTPPTARSTNGNHAEVIDPDGDDEPAEADEVARQLASLSPKAARAVAAAARAETDEEREAALAEVTGDGDEPINRGLLLKFLSSVRS